MARVVAESLKAPARVWREALRGLLAEERFAGLNEPRTPVLLLWARVTLDSANSAAAVAVVINFNFIGSFLL